MPFNHISLRTIIAFSFIFLFSSLNADHRENSDERSEYKSKDKKHKENTTNSVVFPDVISAKNEIVINKKVFIKESGKDVMTPLLSFDGAKAHCDKKICKATGIAPESLTPFIFHESNDTNTLEIYEDITLTQNDLGNIVIKGEDITVTFIAPVSLSGGMPIQKIASITGYAKETELVFEAGDYHIGSVDIGSDEHNKKDKFTITSNGNAAMFIKNNFLINKPNHASHKKRAIVINDNKPAKSLMIFTQGDIDIRTDAGFLINAVLYSYRDITVDARKESRFKGTIHADKRLYIGDATASSNAKMKFSYDEDFIRELYLVDGRVQALPNDPGREGRATLVGIDSNRNGIRDDMEIWVLKTFPNDTFGRDIYMNSSLAEQEALTIDVGLPESEYYKIVKKMRIAYKCYSHVYKTPSKLNISREFYDQFYNTRARLERYSYFRFQVISAPRGMNSKERRLEREKCQEVYSTYQVQKGQL